MPRQHQAVLRHKRRVEPETADLLFQVLLPPALSLFGERDVHVAHDHAPPRLNLHLLVLFRAFQDVRKRPPPPRGLDARGLQREGGLPVVDFRVHLDRHARRVVDVDVDQLQRDQRPVHPDVLLEVVAVPDLAGDGDAFAVERALRRIELHRLLHRLAHPAVQKPAHNEAPCPPLPSLAVYCSDVARISGKPVVDVGAERADDLEGWGVVVVERKALDAVVELSRVVGALGAEVVDFVGVRVVRFEEPVHLRVRVAVDALEALGGEAHGDDARSDVGEVKVEVRVHEPLLLLGDECLDS
mmetsp:Transcript_46417/g.109017  ORF Transcript_46417/g.109017 Transcript_46417/m.109017 type:complete len:299 (+) Transcript_46417:953-1849(+)